MSLKVLMLLTLLLSIIVLCLVTSYATRLPLSSAFKLIFNANSSDQSSASLWGKSIVILLIFVTSAIVIDISLRLVFNYNKELTTYYSSFFFLHKAGTDSWYVMVKALEHFDSMSTESVYEALILKDYTKFQYPPSALLVFDIPKRLFGFSYEQLIDMMNKICWLCVPLMAINFFFLQKNTANALFPNHHTQSDLSNPYNRFLVPALALLASAIAVEMFYPVVRSYRIGQIQTVMTLLVGLALLAWQTKRFGLAGVLLSICCSFKPQWVVLIPWAFIRKQWSFLISFSITSTAIFLITTALYGVKNWFDYVNVLSFLGKVGESYYPNQSVNGLLHRIFMNGNNLNWVGNAFPPFHPVVYVATLLTSLLILGLAIVWRRKYQPTVVDLSIVMLSLTLASPIAWEHHYGVTFLLFAIAIPLTIVYKPIGRWSFVYLWVTYLLVSQNYGYIASGLADTRWNFLQSTLFFGILLLLFYFYKISASETIKNKT